MGSHGITQEATPGVGTAIGTAIGMGLDMGSSMGLVRVGDGALGMGFGFWVTARAKRNDDMMVVLSRPTHRCGAPMGRGC